MLLAFSVCVPGAVANENSDSSPGLATVAASDAREHSLITMLVLKRLLFHYQKAQAELPAADPVQPEELVLVDYAALANQFADDRAWLQSLITRPLTQAIEPIDLRSSGYFNQVLRLSLEQHSLVAAASGLTDAVLEDLLFKLVFEHKQRALLRALMPYLLRRAEDRALIDWQYIEQVAEKNPDFKQLLGTLDPKVVEPFAQPVLASGRSRLGMDAQMLTDFTKLVQLLLPAVDAEKPAPGQAETVVGSVDEFTQLSVKLRTDLLGISDQYEVMLPIYTLDALTALQTGNELVFVNGLVALTTKLMDQYEESQIAALSEDEQVDSESGSTTAIREIYPAYYADWLPHLSAKLPGLQQAFSADLSQIDLRLNSAMAMTVEVFQQLSNKQLKFPEQRRKLLAARAVLTPLLPDYAYFHQPVRDRISEEIAMCASIVATSLQQHQNISAEQFAGCINSFKDIGLRQAANIPLSGNSRGPWEPEQLRRELDLTPWQRVNYVLAYLRDEYAGECANEERLINPLEWSLQSTVMAWFAAKWPAFAGTDASEDVFEEMLSAAGVFIQQVEENKACLTASNGSLVQQIMLRYGQRLEELIASIDTLEQQFRSEKLAPGADIRLSEGASQKTNYRPAELQILPCNQEKICEATQALSANLALVGLFPTPYLVADQSRMGEIEICYDQVRWVNRRQSQARKNDPEVSNYYAQLSFSVKGRFHQDEVVTEVFEREFVSPDEYLYLFAASDSVVLEEECPMALVGQTVTTQLRNSRLPGIVPNRLTYLTAARTLPSRLFSDNWDKGAQWHDWFVTGSGVEIISQSDGSELIDSVNNYLHSLSESREAMLYSALLSPPLRNNAAESLAMRVSALSLEKSLLKSVLAIFYGDLLSNNEQLRAALTGQSGLLDNRVLRRLREASVSIHAVGQLARKRSQAYSDLWLRLMADEASSRQNSLSVSPMLAMAWLQLKQLQNLHFNQLALPEESLSEDNQTMGVAQPSVVVPEQ